jgi:putative acetyltransferase
MNELRARDEMRLALVAELRGEIVGCVAVSPMTVQAGGAAERDSPTAVCAIGPLAVLGALQRNGIGAMLMAEAIQRLRDAGADLIALLGDPGYYERFRFAPARSQRLACRFDGGDAFQIRPLTERGRSVAEAELRYASAFDLFDDDAGGDPL